MGDFEKFLNGVAEKFRVFDGSEPLLCLEDGESAEAILAVIACGFLAWSGRLTWGIAGSVIFGIVLVFGSAQIVQFFQSAVGR